MNKENLIKTAEDLKKISPKAYKEYIAKSDELVALINELFLNRQDINKLIGEQNHDMMKDNHSNHVKFMASVFKNFNAEVLTETILWVFRAYQSHGFSSNYWATQLNAWIEILKNNLTEDNYKEIYPYYEWMLINIPIFVKLSNEDLIGFRPRH